MAFGGRLYTHNGRKLPSVTTVTGQLDKPALVQWAANCAIDYVTDNLPQFAEKFEKNFKTKEPEFFDSSKILKEWDAFLLHLNGLLDSAKKNYSKVSARAMDIGSAVHAAIERYLTLGQEPEAPSDEVLSAFIGFLDWMSKNHVETIHAEQTVYATFYAGTTDLVAMFNNKKYVIDFKTYNETSKTKPPYPEAKYQVAAYRSCVEGAEGCGLLYLGKSTGKMNWEDTSDTYKTDIIFFNHLVDMYYLKHPELMDELYYAKYPELRRE